MAFEPEVGQELTIDDVVYRIAEHPAARGIPYGQEGRQAIVYQLLSGQQKQALKVFKASYPAPSLVALARRTAPYASLPGLQVCRRTVLSPQAHATLLREYPDLTYSVLMLWVEGPTWMERLLAKEALSPEQSLSLAHSLVTVLSNMEQEGLAHCDLSGPNVMLPVFGETPLPASSSAVALVDVEQMYGPELRQPEQLAAGSPGYAHQTAADGLWSQHADRFAGAVLIAEMIGWCDERVRNASWGESYFDPQEMQRDTERYRLLSQVLGENWGENVRRLFQRAWTSPTLAACPTFGEWLVTLPEKQQSTAPTVATVAAGVQAPATEQQAPQYAATLDSARRFEALGNKSAALDNYRLALALAPAGSGLADELKLIVRNLEEEMRGGGARQPAATAAAATATTVPPAPAEKASAPAADEAKASTAPATASSGFSLASRWYLVAIPIALLVIVMVAIFVFVGGKGGSASNAPGTPVAGVGDSTAGPAGTPTMNMSSAVTTSQALGLVRFHDASGGTINEVTVLANSVPPAPSGSHYEVRLVGSGGEERLSLGGLTFDASGHGSLDYVSKNNQNLLSKFDSYQITIEQDPAPNPNPSGPVVYSSGIGPHAMEHVRHLIVAFPDTPNQTPLCPGLVRTTQLVFGLASAMQRAQQQGDVATMKRNAESLVNTIEGGKRDLDGDGKVSVVGDGFGLLVGPAGQGYVQTTIAHAQLAMNSDDATVSVKTHGNHVIISAKNVGDWATQLRDLALKIVASKSTDMSSADVKSALTLADHMLNGQDLDGDESVDPVPNEGGAITAYQHAQYMADMLIQGSGAGATPSTTSQP